MTKVFVYGTLRKGEDNAGYLTDAIEVSLSAVTGGRLVDTGFGYPALVREDEADTQVRGELYEVEDGTLRELDRLEDYYGPGDRRNEYERVRVQVETEWGSFDAWAYVYAKPGDLAEAEIIEDGDWAKYRNPRRSRPPR